MNSDSSVFVEPLESILDFLGNSVEQSMDFAQDNFHYTCPKKPEYVNLVLSGGSTKGLSQVGALQKLIDEGLLDLTKIKAVAGASAGSMIAALIVLGFTTEEIWDFLFKLDFSKLVNPDFTMLLEKCGVDNGKIVYDLMEDILTTRTKIKHITFKQLRDFSGIDFTIIGTCLTKKEEIHYNHINTPNFKVSMAIRISIGMPGFFSPIVINGEKYIDGAVLNDYPINLFEKELDKTIGVLVCNEYSTECEYFEEYIIAVMNLFMYNYFKRTMSRYASNTICICKELPNLSIFDFDLSVDTKTKLFRAGQIATEEFIKKELGYHVLCGDFDEEK